MTGVLAIAKSRIPATQKAPFSRNVEIFLDMMAAERGASANTLEAYNRDLNDFGLFMQNRREKIEEADAKRIKQYLSQLYVAGRAATTRARHLSVLRQFFAFLFKFIKYLCSALQGAHQEAQKLIRVY